jgi:hypothetical protein
MGRAGRLVLLVTVIVGVVIALLIMTTRTAGAADSADGAASQPEPSASPWFGGRVEVPEAGLAVTFPEDWVVELAEEGSDLPILVVAQPELFGPEVELQPLLVAKGPDMRERDKLSLCSLVRYAPIDITTDEFMNETFGQSDWAVIESLREGLSRVLLDPMYTGRILTGNPEALYVDHYAIGADSAVAFLWCTGVATHRGDWLSIAESIEFLPEE